MTTSDCTNCGALLAADQRYCLECGACQGPRRLDPIERARAGGDPGAGAPAPVAPAPVWATLPPAALALGRPKVAAVAAAGVLAFGALLGASVAPGPQSASAGRVYVARVAAPAPVVTPAPHAAPDPVADDATADTTTSADTAPADTAPAEAPPPDTTPDPAKKQPSTGDTTTPASDTPAAQASPAPVKHVWLVSLEGVDLTAAPAMAPLASAGTLLTSYSSVAKGSLANSVAMISGLEPTVAQQANCPTYSPVAPGKVAEKTGLVTGDGCVEPAQAVTLADRLTGAGLVWRAYAEDIGAGAPDQTSCRHPQLGTPDPFTAPRPADAYLTWRNPFAYFRSITDSADCGTAVVGLDRLSADLANAADAPAFSYVVPNACHDGEATPCSEGALAGLDATGPWLTAIVAQIQASPAYADGGLIVVTSPDGPRPDPAATGGVKVGALLLSPYVAAGATVTSAYDHLSLLRTLSVMFGVPAPARAASTDVKAFDAKVFANAPAPGGD